MKVSYSRTFRKQYAKLSPKLQQKTDERILMWYRSPSNPALRDHQLTGKQKIYRSINITGDLRALYLQRGDEVVFDAVGTHSQLYG